MEKTVSISNRAGVESVAMLLLCLLGAAGGSEAQDSRGGIDFINERLRIPDSARFNEGDYIESGVGLKFGIDRRLSYNTGNYEDSVEQFEEAVIGFRYKSEIWVLLARAYFYMKSPEMAKETIERAMAIMPDLDESFWKPLMESMLDEIRKRANKLQTQVDFYSKEQGDFLSLFRLYKFLEDHRKAIGVVHAAEGKGNKMNELAAMVSGPSQRIYHEESIKWKELSDQLRGELLATGIEVPPAPSTPGGAPSVDAVGKDPELLEATRILQLKIDFYPSQLQDYRDLFANYLSLDMPEKAAGVIEALGREIKRGQLQAAIASDYQEEIKQLDKVATMEGLQKELKSALEGRMGGGTQ